MEDEFTKHVLAGEKLDGLDPKNIFMAQSFLKRFEEHMYAAGSDAKKERSMINAMLHHILEDNFKTFEEFLRSITEFLLTPFILLKLEAGQLIAHEGDFPEYDRGCVLLLQGDGTGRCAIDHLARLFMVSARPEQVQYILDNFEFFTGQPPPFVYQTNVQGCQVPVPFSVWERLARASQNLIKIAGRFHMKLNFIVD